MNDYTQSQWQRYQLSRNPEFLWRIASHLNWLTPQEERSACGQDLSVDRIENLESRIKNLSETEK